MKEKLSLSQAIAGFDLACRGRRLSIHTIQDYSNTLRKAEAYFGDDPLLENITVHQIQSFLASQTGLTNKTILNYHTGLSALWTWAVKEQLVLENIVHMAERPKPEKRAIVPLSQEEIRSILNVLGATRTYTRPGKRSCANTLPIADRNRAIILLLLDTGIRASELCEATIKQVNFKTSHIQVFGKGSKERSLPFSPRTAQVLWKYANHRIKNPNDPLFLTQFDRPMDRDRLLKSLVNIGQRAEVADVHPHRFRHTFAINYLRNGGDPWSLQMMLGHSSMEMVHRYLAIAQTDLDARHRIASPVENWRL